MATLPTGPTAPLNPPPQQGPQGTELDPVYLFKMLMPRLSESLATLMRVAANVLHHNAQVDTCTKIGENQNQRLDKSLEDFYSLCDQMESNLRLAIECHSQAADSAKNTPLPVQGAINKPIDQTPEMQTYAQYLTTVRTQIACAKEIHDILIDYAKKICEHGQLHPSQQPPSGS